MTQPQISGLDHLVLTVRDMQATIRFYAALGMRAEAFQAADGTTRHALMFGTQKINLHEAKAPFAPHAAHPGPGTADLCFLSETPLDAWQDHLSQHGITIEEGPVPRSGATGPILSLYLRDPDGNLIEISTPA